MIYFEELTNYSYLNYENSKNIGWLDSYHKYQKGEVSEEFLDNLWKYIKVNINSVRGSNNCSLCSKENKTSLEVFYKGESKKLGFSEIRVLSEDSKIAYAAPDLIYHYILEHNYIPPDEFIFAVIKGPKPGTEEYEKYLSHYQEYNLRGNFIKNIKIVQRGKGEDNIKITQDFHTAINDGDISKISEIFRIYEEQISKIIDLSTWLFIAASEGKIEIVKYLLDKGAKMDLSRPNNNPLFGAISGGHTQVAILLIESGIDISKKYCNPFMKNKDALTFAKEKGRLELVNLLNYVTMRQNFRKNKE